MIKQRWLQVDLQAHNTMVEAVVIIVSRNCLRKLLSAIYGLIPAQCKASGFVIYLRHANPHRIALVSEPDSPPAGVVGWSERMVNFTSWFSVCAYDA